MFFRCGTKMSFRAVRKPHIKKSVVAIAMALLSVETGTAVTIGDCGVAIAMQFRTLNLIRAALSKILSEDFLKDGIKSYIHDKIVSGCIKSDALCLLGL